MRKKVSATLKQTNVIRRRFLARQMRAESEQLNIKIMKTILTGKKKEISEKLKKIDLENLINKQKLDRKSVV